MGDRSFVTYLTLAQRGGVSSDQDKLGLSGAEGLEGRLVSQSDYCWMWSAICSDCLFNGRVDSDGVPLPDFITSARRELMVLASFLDFLTGAIVANSRVLVLSVVFDWYAPAKLV